MRFNGYMCLDSFMRQEEEERETRRNPCSQLLDRSRIRRHTNRPPRHRRATQPTSFACPPTSQPSSFAALKCDAATPTSKCLEISWSVRVRECRFQLCLERFTSTDSMIA